MNDLWKLISNNPVLLVLAIVAGFSGNYVGRVVDPPRPDPFTGTQGKALEYRINKNEEHFDQLAKKLDLYNTKVDIFIAASEQRERQCERERQEIRQQLQQLHDKFERKLH